jgi:hypothetical protein
VDLTVDTLETVIECRVRPGAHEPVVGERLVARGLREQVVRAIAESEPVVIQIPFHCVVVGHRVLAGVRGPAVRRSPGLPL